MKSFGLIIRIFATLLLIIPAIFVSCEKDLKKIGVDIQPPEDKLPVHHTDTSSLISYSVREDSVRTDELSINLLGSNFDPVFGKTIASFATQVRMSKSGIDFGENPRVDSLILSMVYVGYYGDINTTQTVRVYELLEDILIDSSYYSNKKAQHSDIDLAHHTFIPKPNDSLIVDGITQPPQLRINLSAISPILANKIFNASEDVLADNDQFLEYFKGLYITTDPLNYEGSILYFNMITATSSLTLYYSNDSLDGLSFDMLINENCTRFNQYEHFNYDFADQQLRKQIIFTDTTLGKDILYLQSMGGVKSMIRFPYLSNFTATTKIAVNEAVLYLHNNNAESEYDAPISLTLLRLDEDGDLVLLTDYFEGSDYFGGVYDEGSSSYKFRITRFVQEVLSGELTDPVLNLSISGASTIANRVVLNGPENQINKIRLEITYIELD